METERQGQSAYVALLVSAWIEIMSSLAVSFATIVALLVSAWIEILSVYHRRKSKVCRTPRECVD